MLRVHAGNLRGRRLASLPGLATRPTLEKNRALVFNVLQSRLDLGDYQFIDLFAGSGAMGIEALSQGVRSAWLVENQPQAFALLRQNLESLGLTSPQAQCSRQDARAWLKRLPALEPPLLFYLDPPYQTNLAQEACGLIAGLEKSLLEEGVLVLEQDQHDQIQLPDGWEAFQSKSPGRVRLQFISLAP